MSASNVQNFLYRDCGLKGLSGVSNDMRELEASKDPKAKLAIDYFVYPDRAQRRHAGGCVAGPRRLRLYSRYRGNSVGVRARIAISWHGSALRSIQPKILATRA